MKVITNLAHGIAWPSTLLGLIALLYVNPETRAQDKPPEDLKKIRVEVMLDDLKTQDDLRKLQAQLKLLEAQMAQKKAEAAKLTNDMILVEANRALVLQKEKAARQVEDARSKVGENKTIVIQAKKVDRGETVNGPARHAIVLQQDGKQVLELPSEVIIAERNGKLIIEIPLAGTEGKKTAAGPTAPAAGYFTYRTQVSGSSEDRIANLEKKLAEILKELEGLRKEMKAAPSGTGKTTAVDPTAKRWIVGDLLVTPPAATEPAKVIANPATPAAPKGAVPPTPAAKPETSADGRYIKRMIELVTPVDPIAPKEAKILIPPTPATPAKPGN